MLRCDIGLLHRRTRVRSHPLQSLPLFVSPEIVGASHDQRKLAFVLISSPRQRRILMQIVAGFSA
jgi:hypothetical protein